MDSQITDPGLVLFQHVKIPKPYIYQNNNQWIDLLYLLKSVVDLEDPHRILTQTMHLLRYILSEGGLIQDRSVLIFCEPSIENPKQFQISFESSQDKPSTALEISELAHLFHLAIGTGEPFLIQQSGSDPIFINPPALRTCVDLYCLPVHLDSNNMSWLMLGHSQPGFFSIEKLELINLIWSIVSPVMQKNLENKYLEQENYRLHAFQDEFKQKLAKELHDGPAQSLSSLAMRVDIARRVIERDAAQSKSEFLKAENLIKQTARDLRYLLILTRLPEIESGGLCAYLESYAEKISDLYDLSVTINSVGNFDDLPEIWQPQEIFHLVEELISNARKSTSTKHIWVQVIKKTDSLIIDIDDDGDIFNPDQFSATDRGLDFLIIQALVDRLGGTIKVSPSIKGGINIHIACSNQTMLECFKKTHYGAAETKP
jgi:signal transduction histidine kinase